MQLTSSFCKSISEKQLGMALYILSVLQHAQVSCIERRDKFTERGHYSLRSVASSPGAIFVSACTRERRGAWDPKSRDLRRPILG